MTSGILQGVRVAILVSNGFDESELLAPRLALDQAGAATFVIAPTEDKVTGSDQRLANKQVSVDIPLKSAKAEDFHALFLPGGTTNANHLGLNPEALQFVHNFMQAGKPVAAIGEGPAILLKTGTLRGRTLTSSAFLEGNLRKAGASYVDEEIVCDGNLITARTCDDVSAFSHEMIRVLAELREHSTEMRRIA